jgi:hypothetical protein
VAAANAAVAHVQPATPLQLSPVASVLKPHTQPVQYELPYIGNKHRAYFQVDFAGQKTPAFTITVEAGSRLQRQPAAATLARIFARHGFDNLLHVVFHDLLNLNACLAMGMLGFWLADVRAVTSGTRGFSTDYHVTFAATFPARARKVASLVQPPVSAQDLQYQTVLHNNKFWMSRLNIATEKFEWRKQDKPLHRLVRAKLDKTRAAMRAVSREHLDNLQTFFSTNHATLTNYHAVGTYVLGEQECWFLGTMQDVFDKWQLLQKQPGAPVHLLNGFKLAFFAKPHQHRRDELARVINMHMARHASAGSGTAAPLVTGAALCYVPDAHLDTLVVAFDRDAVAAFRALPDEQRHQILAKNGGVPLRAMLDFAIDRAAKKS